MFGHFNCALDLGAGEGWITKDLPAYERWGYELSDNAAARFPPAVKRVLEPAGKYDLVVATGVLYGHYDWRKMLRIIRERASRIVLTCHIKSWELAAVAEVPGMQIIDFEFPYRDWTQKLRVFEIK